MANAPTGKPVLNFDVYKGTNRLFSKTIDAESVTIGRGPAATLQIEDASLAELHAVINLSKEGKGILLDLGSAGGTKVNGEPVNSSASVQSGDQIEMGDMRLLVSITSAEDAASNTAVVDQTSTAPKTAAPPPAAKKAKKAPVKAKKAAKSSKAKATNTEDVMAYIRRSGTGAGNSGINRKGAKVLEVVEIWSDTIQDVKHYNRDCEDITVGTATGHRWRFLGKPIAWVPDAFAKVAWTAAPTLSEVNEEWRNEFHVPADHLPHDNYALFGWADGTFVCNFSDQWTGSVSIDGKERSFKDLIASNQARSTGRGLYQLDIDDNNRVLVHVGQVSFFAHQVHPGRKIVAGLTENVDLPFLGIMAFMGVMFLCLTILILNTEPRTGTEVIEIPDRFVELLLEQPEEEKPADDPRPEDANPDAGEGAKAKEEEGKVGKRDAKMEKAKGNKVEMQERELDREIAENAGVLGALDESGELDGMFGSSALNADLTGGLGGLLGAKGTQIGAGGLGSRGSGLGGGGTAAGLGGLGTQGRGSGRSGYGQGGGSFGEKGEGGIGRIGGDPIILGALDKSLIDAVIKRHMNQIRYCYQRELTRDPSLGGKITIKFVIAKDGSVSRASIKTSTMGSSAVENCIAGRFRRFQFPEPKGGGIVIVSYPFIFSPG